MKERGSIGCWSVAMAALLLILSGCGGGDSSTSGAGTTSSGGGGTGISNSYDAPAEMSVGDIMAIEFESSTNVSVDFSDVEAGANFILALGSYNSSGSGTSIQLSTDIVLPEANAITKGMAAQGIFENTVEDGFGPNEILSAWLRASESELQYMEDPADLKPEFNHSKSMGINSMKAAVIGDTETFKVLNSLTSTASFTNVTGEVRCVGDHVVFYVDQNVPSSILSDANLQILCDNFDIQAGDEIDLLGDTSDVDGDGKFHALMTKEINELGALGGGIITGYFYAGDLYSSSSSNSASNEREIIYTMVPDPTGAWGTAISIDFAMSNLLPAVLPHELQHAISYNQHVFVNGGSPEENWLNEGLSHFMEDYLGVGAENPSRYAMYLASPSTYGLVTQGSPNLMERGASFLFMRYLYEQASDGDAFLRSLFGSDTGVANLESAFSGFGDMDQFSEMVARWTIALIMTDRGISNDARYIYQPRVRNSVTNNWEGACLMCDADDNRGTELTGINLNAYYGYHTASIDSGTAKYYEMTTLPNQMELEGSASGGNFGILVRTQ